MINPRALHVRLIAWHMLLLSALVLAFGTYTYLGMQHYLISDLQTTLARRATQITDYVVSRPSQMGDAQIINEIKTLYAPEANDRFIRITRADGSVLYVSGTPKDLSFDPAGMNNIKSNISAQRSEPTVNNNRIYIAAVTTSLLGNNRQHYIVEVGASDRQIQNALNGLLATLVIGFPVLLILAAGGAYLLIERSLTPVTTIMNAAEDISLHNLSRRLPVAATGDKLEHLSRALNRMIARLDETFQQASRFTADASHELRTPLTIIRGELEFIAQQSHLPADLREQLGSLLEETERLTHITEGLLAIARLEAGEAKVEPSVLDLGALATNTAEQMELLAEEKKIELRIITDQDTIINGDPARIKQVVVNLLDNALKYTPENGVIEVRVTNADGHAILSLTDTGAGIPKQHLPHIFERFYRADKIRDRTGGAGLGLSIVHSICTAHGGTVQAESTPGQGSRFTVILKLARTDPSTDAA